MKAVFITYNQAHTERVDYMLDRLEIRGFTRWEQVTGRGSQRGQPHMGTHTWPEMNASVMAVVQDELVSPLLQSIKKLDAINEEVGIRAFVWNVEQSV